MHLDSPRPQQLVFSPTENPYGRTWPQWTAIWCNWLLSISKTENPALDSNGSSAGVKQADPDVWFLAGTFGNDAIVTRRCTIPLNRAILFPVMLKECCFVEDKDLRTESELVQRSKNDMDMITSMEVTLSAPNSKVVQTIRPYRVQSEVYDLMFPENNVYDVNPGLTRSTSNGYWVFLKPLSTGVYKLFFKVEADMPEGYIVKKQLHNMDVYRPIRDYVDRTSSFKIEIIYDLTIV